MQLKQTFFYFSLLFFVCSFIAEGADKKWTYTVLKGDSLWSISQKYLNKTSHYQNLQKLNNITEPKVLQPKTQIIIPMSWIKANLASATVSAITGNSTYVRNSATKKIQLGSVLNIGDILTVAEKSSVTLTFIDGSILTLLEKSQLSIDYLMSYGKTGMADIQLKLHYGKVETQAKKSQGPGSRLDISTVSALSSVRGTIYRVAHSEENSNSLIEVLEGEVAVAAQQQSENIAAGFASKVIKGQAPSKPISLLPPPRWLSHKARFEGQNVTFSWQTNNDAKAYKVQLSSRDSFSDIIWQQQQKATKVKLENIKDGHYFIRTSAIDKMGIEGIARSAEFTVNNTPKSPNINELTALFTRNRQLSWSLEQSQLSSVIQIASDSEFKNIVIAETLSEPVFTVPQSLPFAKYYWRVAAIDGQGRGPFSLYSHFVWQPHLSDVQWQYHIQGEEVLVSWSTLKPNESVQIQLAQDIDFTAKIETIDTLALNKIPLLIGKNTYVRSRIINKKLNLSGQWSKGKSISNSDNDALVSFAFLALFILL